jgi:hypothetical protein
MDLTQKYERTKDEAFENMLENIGKSGEKRFVNTSIYSDEDIRNFLYYSSRMLKTPELNMELQYIANHPGSSKLRDEMNSVFNYDEVPKEKLLLAAWYSGEKEEDAFRKTEERYIIGEHQKINGIITFRDEKISKEFLYIYISGRFASKDEESLPTFWDPIRVHSKSLRDILLYIIPDPDLKKLGIEFDEIKQDTTPNEPSTTENTETQNE